MGVNRIGLCITCVFQCAESFFLCLCLPWHFTHTASNSHIQKFNSLPRCWFKKDNHSFLSICWCLPLLELLIQLSLLTLRSVTEITLTDLLSRNELFILIQCVFVSVQHKCCLRCQKELGSLVPWQFSVCVCVCCDSCITDSKCCLV